MLHLTLFELSFISVGVVCCLKVPFSWLRIWRSARRDFSNTRLWHFFNFMNSSLHKYVCHFLCRMNGLGVGLTLVVVTRSRNCDRRYLPHPQHGGSFFLVEGLIPHFLCLSFTADIKVNVASLQLFVPVLLMLAFKSVWLFTRILADTHWLNDFPEIRTHRIFKWNIQK